MSKGKKGKGYNVYSTVPKVVLPPCHVGFTQVHENVFVGKATEITDVLGKVDILVPLDNVDGRIWDYKWNGEIFYVPIKDFCVLPIAIEEQKVQYVLDRIKEGKKVAIFCLGGHGRTGYFASLILGKLGIQDPIKHLRETYCKYAVETNEQVEAIAEFLNNPQLVIDYPIISYGYGFGYGSYESNFLEKYVDGYFNNNKVENNVTHINSWCEMCEHYQDKYGGIEWGYCQHHKKTVSKFDSPCKQFK